MGCTTPNPPASDTAATNSGLLPGYMGPLTIGILAPVSLSRRRVAAEVAPEAALQHRLVVGVAPEVGPQSPAKQS